MSGFDFLELEGIIQVLGAILGGTGLPITHPLSGIRYLAHSLVWRLPMSISSTHHAYRSAPIVVHNASAGVFAPRR